MKNFVDILFFLIGILCFSANVFPLRWDYKHEDRWPNICKTGRRQSPIDIPANVTKQKYVPLLFENYNKRYSTQVKNNGHSVELRLKFQEPPTVKGGCVSDTYVLDHLHFHWSAEHTIEGKTFPLELHIVNYNIKYQNLAEALKHEDVAVLSVLFDLSPQDSVVFQPLIKVIDRVKNRVSKKEKINFNLSDYIPQNITKFYCYDGSLTTPGCTEGVIWTVFANTLPISEKQVAHFARLRNRNHQRLRMNRRSLQNLNNRKIYLQEVKTT